MMAAAQAGCKPVVYCAMGDIRLEKDLVGLAKTITKTRVTVKDLWDAIAAFNNHVKHVRSDANDEEKLYPFIERHCRSVARSNL